MDDGLFDDGSADSEEAFNLDYLWKIRNNRCSMTIFHKSGDDRYIQNMTGEDWERLGRDISSNTHLKYVRLFSRALNDHRISFFFRGLTGSSSIKDLDLPGNEISPVGLRSMVPFFQSANSLISLDLDDNNIQSEGFNTLWRSLRDSPIEKLWCSNCGIESIEIENENAPRKLTCLFINGNNITADGCHGLAKLLQGGDSTLECLCLERNKIDDQGVDILVDALRNNTSLMRLSLDKNDVMSIQGQIMLVKLVNDVSSIKATFQSNHTLTYVQVNSIYGRNDVKKQIQQLIDMATSANLRKRSNPEAAGKEKILCTQLNSSTRAALAELQGVRQSLYSEISPLHLPEVLSLVCRHHGQGELYVALKSSIAGVISTVNRKQCLQQERALHEAAIAEHRAFIAKHRGFIAEHSTRVETIEAEIA